jgi:putative phage-type endonuclease
MQNEIHPEALIQGTFQWHALRKTKITATDMSVIMGVNPWKTLLQLYHEKVSEDAPSNIINERMQRGLDLEPIARELFTLKTKVDVEPRVVIKDWAMASLDGISESGNCVVEIKCPGDKDHELAVSGRIPQHYYPQLQHQMYVCDVDEMYYFSFDGIDGVIVDIKRDQEYIDKMLIEGKKFYDCIINKTPPEPTEGDFVKRDDLEWAELAEEWKDVNHMLKDLEIKEEELRKRLIQLCQKQNSEGFGVRLCQVERKGNVEYAKIKELQGVDLEPYRKPPIASWRITNKVA